jgi:hypothetical protein
MTSSLAQELQALSRLALHEKACDELAAEGKKPGISSVRAWTLTHAGIKRGSDTDTQADIQNWYRRLFDLKQARPLPEVPTELATQFMQLWESANAAAWEALQTERRALADAETAAQQRVAAAEQERDRTAATLAARDEEVRRLEAELAARDERIAVLLLQAGEREMLVAEKERRVVELLDAQRRMEHEHKEMVVTLTENQRRPERAREGAERHALQEIEHARMREREARHLLAQLGERQAQEAQAARDTILRFEVEQTALHDRIRHLTDAVEVSARQVNTLQARLGHRGANAPARKDPGPPARPIPVRRRLRKGVGT